MIKTKKTKTKAAAPAKVASEKAQPVVQVPAPAPLMAKAVAANPVQPKVRLEFSQPGARIVAIAGSFNSWQPEQASATGNGSWVTELAIGPGRYEYLFVVDGQWTADPNAKESVPNPFGGQNSVLIISQ
jgi:1,4-alpha-glucan branching enzyme